MTLQITPDRLKEIKGILQEWLKKDSASLRELQSLLGKLNFAASTVRAGRIFISRLINWLKEVPDKGFHKIDREVRKDIEWWNRFMESFDGISIMPPLVWNSPDEVISSDACLEACGGWSNGRAFHKKFPKLVKKPE